jgi:hypothetical protein
MRLARWKLVKKVHPDHGSAEVAATMAAAVVPWRPGPGAEAENN